MSRSTRVSVVMNRGFNMKQGILYMVVTASALVSGCQAFTPPMRIQAFNPTQAQMVDYQADRRGQLIVPSGSNIKSCSEPQPDVAYDSIDKILASAKPATGSSVGGSAEADETALQINQNSQLILFMREALFRLCEISLNERLKPEDVVGLYTLVLNTAVATADAQKAQAEERKNNAAITLFKLRQKSSSTLKQ